MPVRPAAARPQPQDPASVLERIGRDDSPAVARLRARHRVKPDQIQAYRSRQKGTPVWVWALIGAGGVLTLILLVLFLMTR